MTGNPDTAAAASQDWLMDGGAAGDLVRAKDWAQTPLGPRSSWPQSLRTSVSLCLATESPALVSWGPQRTQIYNDAFATIYRSHHPQAMGQDFRQSWQTAWPSIGDAFERAAAGLTTALRTQRMFIETAAGYQETFYNLYFNPIRDESGAVGGLFHRLTETTQQTLAARRLKILRALATATAEATTVQLAVSRAIEALAEHPLDLPFVAIYLLDGANKFARLAGYCGLPSETMARVEIVDLDNQDSAGAWSSPLALAVRARRGELIGDLEQRLGPVHGVAYAEPLREAMLLPIVPSGLDRPLAVLVAGVSTRRPLDNFYRDFYQMLADGITATLSNARVLELERHHAEQLAELDRAKSTFFAKLSHEFRTPLSLILGPLNDVLSQPGQTLSTEDRPQLEMAQRNAQRLLTLVDSLLDFSSAEAGRTQAIYTATDLASLTSELTSDFCASLPDTGLEWIVVCPPLPQPVFVDRAMWGKILFSLLSNAYQFTFSGTIAVDLEWQGQAAVLTVSDTGTGVAQDQLPRLFERFHRVPGARSRRCGGTGMGLALCHELVRLHSGTIGIASVLGQGTTVTVTIPGGSAHLPSDRIAVLPPTAGNRLEARIAFLEANREWLALNTAPARATRGESQTAAQGTERGGQKARILLADDNADMRDYIARLLRAEWEVVLVGDERQALETALAAPPDLILLGAQMPSQDGVGLIRALRADKRTQTIPIIMITIRSDEQAQIEARLNGVEDFLVKPFAARELLARVRTQLELARYRRETATMAQYDALTGLPNRALAYELCERLLASARRHHTQAAVLTIDMDRFKPVNDTWGRETGDSVLREISRRLSACVRSEDTLGRLGSDDFIAVLSGVDAPDNATRVARNVMAALTRPFGVDGHEIHVSPSIGIAIFPDHGEHIDRLVHNADLALLRAKDSGHNNVQLYRDDIL